MSESKKLQLVVVDTKNGKAPVKVKAVPGQGYQVVIDGQVYIGQKTINGKTIRAARKGGNLMIEVEGQEQAAAVVEEFFHPSASSVGDAAEAVQELGAEHFQVMHMAARDGYPAHTLVAQYADASIPTYAAIASNANMPSAVLAAPQVVAEGASAMTPVAAGGGSLAGLLGAGGVAAAAAGASSGASAIPVAYTITLALGPQKLTDTGTTVTLYKADGTKLGDATFSSTTGQYTYTDSTGYKGKVFVSAKDTDTAADYVDEATGQDKSINTTLWAATEITADKATLTISPLTTLAVKKALNVTTVEEVATKVEAKTAATADVVNTNKAVGDLFGLGKVDVAQAEVKFAIDTSRNNTASDANAYGKALVVLSTIEQNTTKTTNAVLTELAAAVTVTTSGTGTTASFAADSTSPAIKATIAAVNTAAAAPEVAGQPQASLAVTTLVTDTAGSITVSGTPTQNQTLTAGSVVDADGGVTGITYQWLANGSPISGATASTYTLTQAEVGKAISVKATYTDALGSGKTATSTATSAVADVDDAGSITVGGTPTQGQILTAGSVVDADGGVTSITYQWLADGSNISGATGSTYTLTQAEVGKAISVKATYTDAQGRGKTATSTATSAVADVDDAGSITITGAATQGQALTAGSVDDADGGVTGITYQWLANGSPISGATASTYTLTQAEVGKAISVKATYTDALGSGKTATSTATSAVADVDDAGSITVSGTPTQNQTLTAGSVVDADGGVTGVTYQWLAGGTPISGATGSTYTLTQAEVGKAISVKATYTDAQGSGKVATSTPTNAVADVNDAPTLTITTNQATFTEAGAGVQGSGALSLSAAGISIGDVDTNATVKNLSLSYDTTNLNSADQLLLSGNAITADSGEVTVNSQVFAYAVADSGSTRTITFTSKAAAGGAEEAAAASAYQALIDAFSYNNTSDTPNTQPLAITLKVNDEQVDSNPITFTINRVASNDATVGTVSISGEVKEGGVLTAVTTGLTDPDSSDIAYSYKWLQADAEDGTYTAIEGATGVSYHILDTQALVGKFIKLEVTATEGGVATVLTSAATAAVVNVNDAAIGSVTIEGTAQEDGTLTAVTTGLSDPDGTILQYSYQWQIADSADGTYSNIANANSATYDIAGDQSQVGKFFKVIVTATNDGTNSGTAFTSAATAAVVNVNDAPTTNDTISAQAAAVGVAYELDIKSYFSDADVVANTGDALTYSISGTLPTGLSFDESTGKISGTASASANARDIIITATDRSNATATQTFSLQVTANAAPTLNGSAPTAISVDEDSATTATSLGLSNLAYYSGNGANESGQTLTYKITAIPAFITLWNGASQVSANTALSLAELKGLTYKTVDNASGVGSVTWTVTDDGSPAQTLVQSLGVTVNAVNDAPTQTTAGAVATVNEDANNTTAVNLWSTAPVYGVGGGSDESSQTLSYKITAIPAFINLFKADGTAVAANATVTAAEFAALKYKTVANGAGTGNITFDVVDSGSSTSPNVNTLSGQNVSVTVNAVNDAPTQTTAGAVATVNEDANNTTAVNLWSTAPVYGVGGGSDESSQTLSYKITAIPAFINLFKADGTAVAANATVTAAEFAALKYKTVANGAGTGNITFDVVDSGSSTSPNVNTLSGQNVSVTVNAVNDAPTQTTAGAVATVDEDANNATAVNLWSTAPVYGVGGGSDESSQTLSYKITAIPAFINLFKADGTAVAANATVTAAEFAALKYKTVANGAGTGNITFDVVDSGSSTSPNVNTLSGQNVSVTVNAVNDAPTQTTAGAVATVDEDANNATAVNLWSTAPVYGVGGGSDESSQTLSYKITAIPAFINLFKSDGTTAVAANATVTAAEFAALKYKTVANGAGTGNITFDVVDSGSSTSPNVNTLSGQNVSVTVNAVNDAPTQTTAGAVATVNEDTNNATAVNLWSTAPVYGVGGGSDESSQTLSYKITAIPAFINLFKSDGTTAVAANATVTAAEFAALKYKTVANGAGTGNITFDVVDSGSSTSPNVNTLSGQNVSVTVNAVNDAPTQTTAGAVATVNEDANNTTAVNLWSTAPVYGVGGGSDESSQTLSYKITAIPAFINLFKADGTAVAANATVTAAEFAALKYKTVANGAGTGNITFDVVDSGSSTSPNVNTLSGQNVSVTVNAVNDAPTQTTAGAVATVDEDANNATAVNLWSTAPVYGVGGGSDESSQTLSYKITAIPAFINLFKADGTAVAANATVTAAEFAALKYKTVANGAGTGNITFDVVDSGSSTSPNVNTLSGQNVSVTVNAVNDAPTQTTAGAVATVDEDANNATAVNLWSTAPVYGVGGGSDESSQTLSYKITAIPAFINLFKSDGTTAVAANATVTAAEFAALKYKTVANGAGTGNITFDVVDSGSSTSPNVNTLSGQNVSVTVTAVDDIATVTLSNPSATLTDTSAANTFTTTTGTVTVTDPDTTGPYALSLTGADTTTGPFNVGSNSYTVRRTGTYGTFYLNTSTAAYAFVPNDTAVNALSSGTPTPETFTVNGGSGSSNFTVNVTGANDTPVLTSSTQALTSVDATAGTPSGAVGDLVSNFVSGIRDADTGALRGIAITAVNGGGTLWYSTNAGANWSSATGLSDTSALLLASNTSTRIYYQPATGASAGTTIANAIVFEAWDQTSGTAGTTANTTTGTAFSTATQGLSLSLTDANAPLAVSNFLISADSGTYTPSTSNSVSFAITAVMNKSVTSGSRFTATFDNGQTVVLTAASAGRELTGTYTVGTTIGAHGTADLTVTGISVVSVTPVGGSLVSSLAVPTNNIGNTKDIVIAGTMLDVTTASGLPTASNGSNFGVVIAALGSGSSKGIFAPAAGKAAADPYYTASTASNAAGVSFTSDTGTTMKEGNFDMMTNERKVLESQLIANPTAVDFNNDGRMDVAYYGGYQNMVLLQNTTSNGFVNVGTAAGLQLHKYAVPTPSTSGAAQIKFADFNGDGFVDAFANIGHSISNAVYGMAFNNMGNGGFGLANGLHNKSPLAGGAGTVLFGDFNGDGYLDLLMGTQSANVANNGNQILRIFTNSQTGFASTTSIYAQSTSSSAVVNTSDVPVGTALDGRVYAAADYDQDGKLDLFVGNGTQGNGTLLRNAVTDSANATFLFSKESTANTPTFSAAVTNAAWMDYNMDGWLDLITTEGTANSIKVYTSKGKDSGGAFVGFNAAQAAAATGLNIGANTAQAFNVADVNNDGKLDLYVSTSGGDYLFANMQALPTGTTYKDIEVLGKVGSTPLYGAKVELTESGTGKVFTQFVQGDTGTGTNQGAVRFYGLIPDKTYDVKVTYAFDSNTAVNTYSSNKDNGIMLRNTVFTQTAVSVAGTPSTLTLRVDPSDTRSNQAANFPSWNPVSTDLNFFNSNGTDQTFTVDPAGSVYSGTSAKETLDFGATPTIGNSNNGVYLQINDGDATGARGNAVLAWNGSSYFGATAYNQSNYNSSTGQSSKAGVDFKGIDQFTLTGWSDNVVDNWGVSIDFGSGTGNDSLTITNAVMNKTGINYLGGAGTDNYNAQMITSGYNLWYSSGESFKMYARGTTKPTDIANDTNYIARFDSFVTMATTAGVDMVDVTGGEGTLFNNQVWDYLTNNDTIVGSSNVDTFKVDGVQQTGVTGVSLTGGNNDILWVSRTGNFTKVSADTASSNALTIKEGSAVATGSTSVSATWDNNGNWFQGSLSDASVLQFQDYRQLSVNLANMTHGVTVKLETATTTGTLPSGVTVNESLVVTTPSADLIRVQDTSMFSSGAANNSSTVTPAAANDTIEPGRGNDTVRIVDTTKLGRTTIRLGAYVSSDATFGNGSDVIDGGDTGASAGFATNGNSALDAGEDVLDLRALFSANNDAAFGRPSNVSIPDQATFATYIRAVASGSDTKIQFDRDAANGTFAFTDILTLKGVALTDLQLWDLKTAGQIVI